MSVSFCGFSGDSTVGDIRSAFADEEKCVELIKRFRKDKSAKFDAITAIILNGYGTSKVYQKNFCKHARDKEDKGATTWRQNTLSWTFGKVQDFKDFIKDIDENTTLSEIYTKITNCNNWVDGSKQNNIINFLFNGKD